MAPTSVICYHGTWSQYRTGRGQFSISDVPARLFTHYIYAFVGLDAATSEVISLDNWLDIGLNGFSKAVGLKKINPKLKVLLAIGGWNEGSAKYSAMAADRRKRATFIASALSWVQKYGFDGFDIDWEYPARRDSNNPDDKKNFSLLIKEFHESFRPLGLMVTAAVSATRSSIDTSYEVPALARYLDFINVMSYDFHGAWDGIAGHCAPLRSTPRLASTEYADYNVEASIRTWMARGAPASKLALGIPLYGRTFTLSSSSLTAPGSVTTGSGGPAGPYSATPGSLGYNEIVEKFSEGGWTAAWDDRQQVPYAYKGNTWVSHDDERSIALKVAFAKSQGITAIMVWAVETDDFNGITGTQFPLLKAIKNAL